MKTRVTIVRKGTGIKVSNDKGQSWIWSAELSDTSTRAAIAQVASAMLCSTIAANLEWYDTLVYDLEVHGPTKSVQ